MSIIEALRHRILVLDGAMATMLPHNIMHHSVMDIVWPDSLVLSNPDIISNVHREYIKAGADIITSCTFNANSITLGHGIVKDINAAATQLAKSAAAEADRQVWVAGCVGPTSVSLTKEIAVDNRAVVDVLGQTFFEQILTLIDGGVDVILIESVYDLLNGEMALKAAERAFEVTCKRLPVFFSATIGQDGLTPAGQPLDDMIELYKKYQPEVLGLNCTVPTDTIIPYVIRLQSQCAAAAFYPNAGLPDCRGKYNVTPQQFCDFLEPLISQGLFSIVGGCCGTTPRHIAHLSQTVKKYNA